MTEQQIQQLAEESFERDYPDSRDQFVGSMYDVYLKGYRAALENQWVSVEEGLPELHTPVLVFEEFYIMHELHHVVDIASFTGKYHENGRPQFVEDAEEPGYYYPSHWQPLPQPPKR